MDFPEFEPQRWPVERAVFGTPHPPRPPDFGHWPDASPQAIPQSAAVAVSHPFKVLDASITGQLGVKVYLGSYLFNTTSLDSPYSISGLDAAQNVAVGNVAYLELTLDSSLAITTAVIHIGATWSGYAAMFHLDTTGDPFIDKMRILLAEIVAVGDTRDGTQISDGTNTAKIVQRWRSNILLLGSPTSFAAVDIAGVPGFVPMPFA